MKTLKNDQGLKKNKPTYNNIINNVKKNKSRIKNIKNSRKTRKVKKKYSRKMRNK
jgi:hypothetical protein